MDPYRRLEVDYAKMVNGWLSVHPLAPSYVCSEDRMVVCSSGTAALHLAMESFRLPVGSRAIVPDWTMVACARAVTMADIEPVFIPPRYDNLLIDLDAVEALLDDPTKREGIEAIMIVHIYGRIVDMDRVAKIANKYNLYVVEDLAEAHGVQPHPRTDAACWSFYRNKIIGGEEGGAIAFHSSNYAAAARSLRSLGFTKEHDYRHFPRGHNYRMSNIHAHLILESMTEYDLSVQGRHAQIRLYDHFCPEDYKMPLRTAPWVYDLKIPKLKKADQDRLVKALKANGVDARHGFCPMTRQPEYHLKGVENPVADRLANEVIYLPVHPRFVGADTVERGMQIVIEFERAR